MRRRRAVAAVAAAVVLAVAFGPRPDGSPADVPARAPEHSPSARVSVPEVRWVTALGAEPVDVAIDGGARLPDAFVLTSRAVARVAARDGAVRWQEPVAEVVAGVAVGSGIVVVGTDTGVQARAVGDGTLRWSTAVPGGVDGLTMARDVVVAAASDGGLIALGVDGAILWVEARDAWLRGRLGTDPDGAVVAAVFDTPDGTLLRVVDARTGLSRWERSVAPWASSPGVGRDVVVVGEGDGEFDASLLAFALVDGVERFRVPTPASFQADLVPAVVGDDVFAVDQLGTVVRVDLTAGELEWATALGEPVLDARPVVVGERVVLATQAADIAVLGRRDGALDERLLPGGIPIAVADLRPHARDGLLVVATRRHRFQVRALAPSRSASTGGRR